MDILPEIEISPEIIPALQLLLTVIIAYSAAVWLALVGWTYQDIRRRTHSWVGILFSALVVLLFGLPGIILYIMLRPPETLAVEYERKLEETAILRDLEHERACPTCKRDIDEDFVICPHCTTELKRACSGCERAVKAHWQACPYCTTSLLAPELPEPSAPAEEEAYQESPART